MSHWFHRNVLKATALMGFSHVLTGPFNLTKLGSDLKRCRDRLLDLLPDPSHNLDVVNAAFLAYLSLMTGFFMDYKMSGRKVRYTFVFKWTHSLLGQVPEAQQDAAFDVANMSINVALWHMKHAAFVSSKQNVSMDDAKEIHTSLRKAAGIFQMVERDLIPLLEHTSPSSDLDHRVISAYIYQCIAEAQEVTVARAKEMQHSDNLISALSNETSKMFETSHKFLQTLDRSLSGQWMLYLQVKRNFYLAYAYCYSGKQLLSEDHCGEAIRALKESQEYYIKALSLSKSYSKAKGPAKPVKPEGHLFFTGINATVTELLEKCERENGFIYHQKVPDSPQDLEVKAAYGLAKPETYKLPAPSPIWEAAFEKSDEFPVLPSSALEVSPRKREKELPPPREINYSESTDGPKDDHGCVVQ